ncbi:MAG: DUF305 domain-containing protein [Desmonostoc vinosum HA7617-LM4]|jgi:uncharacterized protein (DUF305 family)|nr:DUF305 domain-containing protein [Desmonostoc vinosum HA7617-LM4]
MRFLILKNSFLAFSMIAIASLFGSTLTACSTSASQNQASNVNVTNTANKQHMHHDGAMDLGPADANYDLRFIDAMILHHQGAVEMAEAAQEKSKRPQMKKLADDIIKAQNREIKQMRQWRQAWYPKAGAKPVAYDAQMKHMMEMSSEQMQSMMMNMDLGAADEEFDLRFINAMIPHHEGAVTMAKDVLSKSQRPEVKNLAQEIIKSQDAEIKQMQQWRKAWYNK